MTSSLGRSLRRPGVKGAAGLVSLRFGYRVTSLPAALATTDLAVLVEPVERPLKEANVPEAIGASALGDRPLVELTCSDDSGTPHTIKPGVPEHIPFTARDTCRIVFHKERLSPEDGAQRLNLEVDVARVNGEARPEAHVSQSILLRPSTEPRYAYDQGGRRSVRPHHGPRHPRRRRGALRRCRRASLE